MKTICRALFKILLVPAFFALVPANVGGQTVLYQTGDDFPYPVFETGPLNGQDGWQYGESYSSNAAQIVSYTAGQALEIFGPFVGSGGPGNYYAGFSQPLSNYNPVTSETPIVGVSADMWMNLGPTASQATNLYGLLILNDQNGNPYASIGINKSGDVFGTNFASGTVTTTNLATNTFHILRADLNFTNRQVTFYLDGAVLGTTPFNPASSNLVGSVELVLQSSNPIDSNLLLDSLSVTAGTPIPTGGCSIQITSAGPCLSNGTPGIPDVGDLYGLTAKFNISGTPNQDFRIKYTLANVTWYSDTGITSGGDGWVQNFLWWVDLDGPLPWSVTIDPDGITGSTNRAGMTTNGTFTPNPPATAVQLYDPVVVGGQEQWQTSFVPGSGGIANLYAIFGSPSTHGAQNILSVNTQPNATTIITAPDNVPVASVAWTNVSAGVFQAIEIFTAQLNNMRVNPTALRSNTWAQMSALPTNITCWLQPDPVCQSTSQLISNFVASYLPANYKTTMTPYDVARTLHGAVMRSLVYLTPPPYPDATNCLQVGLADCGGYAALLTASMRCAGIPARRILGFWTNDCWQNFSDWHVRAQYYLPNAGWLVTDSCTGNTSDPSGMFSWDFSFVPNANSFFAMDVGDAHVLPYNSTSVAGLQEPAWFYYCSDTCASFLSQTILAYLQPLATASVSNVVSGSLNVSITNTPSYGTVFVQASTNMTSWTTVATNSNPSGIPFGYSFPMSKNNQFFRAFQIP